MTCRECIHYDVCYYIASLEKEALKVLENSNSPCEFFKNKSKFIELPCKVGDVVYSNVEYFGVLPHLVSEFTTSFMGNSPAYCGYIANAYSDYNDEWLNELEFEFSDIGKTVFLTREEAEKALKEMNK